MVTLPRQAQHVCYKQYSRYDGAVRLTTSAISFNVPFLNAVCPLPFTHLHGLANGNRQYFDVPGAMALGDGASRTRREMTKVTGAGGGSSVGGGSRSSDKPAGKRMRIRVSFDRNIGILAVVCVAVAGFYRIFSVWKMLLSCRLFTV